MSFVEDEYCWGENYNKKRTSKRKQMALPGVHIPNKNESKVLRKIMSETGLSEEEIRSHKKYRIQLSEAQKQKGDKTSYQRECIRILKSVTRELKLPKEHPDVKKNYLEKIEKRKIGGYGRWYFLTSSPLFVFNKK